MTRLSDIKARAAAATEGPWSAHHFRSPRGARDYYTVGCPVQGGGIATAQIARDMTQPNAAYIAGLDPPTALWLVALVEGAVEFAEKVSHLGFAGQDMQERASAWLEKTKE